MFFRLRSCIRRHLNTKAGAPRSYSCAVQFLALYQDCLQSYLASGRAGFEYRLPAHARTPPLPNTQPPLHTSELAIRMKKAWKKATHKTGRLVDRLLPSTVTQSPELVDLKLSAVSPAPPPLKQIEELHKTYPRLPESQQIVLPQPVQTISSPPSMPSKDDPVSPQPQLPGRRSFLKSSVGPTSFETTSSVVGDVQDVERQLSNGSVRPSSA